MRGLSARRPIRLSAGFTLVEVLVSLVIAGTAALLAHSIFSAAAFGNADLQAARHRLDRISNSARFLESAFLSLDIGSEGGSGFIGRPGAARFAAWLEMPEGWFERRDIELSVQGGRFIAVIGSTPPLVLSDSVMEVGFDYLLRPGADSRWVNEWVSPVSVPLATRIRITHLPGWAGSMSDTTTFLIKARG
jgi:prepilin-type N-terminal cleavage/methylation domain-containing protein